ncbi:hypothetical protein Verru16b_00948 [Lacunisphaera limnophila]|uniref:Zinc-ribbon domain-containing protein n=1 Tax=Lacunisphaera limnophila TaxID=1838286 RepID=A0A1D8ASR2_9BACT|nr:zinc ribbon domain-containing protein [Lacunisphaera limnophila]AOS43890.1 hypothetical protein Verru16b_00948 [Lacunisphaera limnophila]
MPHAFVPPTECPVCGEAVPRGARACPGCGADERSGWNEEATRYDGLDLPDAAFDDEPPASPRRAPRWLWPVVAFLTLGALIITFLFR